MSTEINIFCGMDLSDRSAKLAIFYPGQTNPTVSKIDLTPENVAAWAMNQPTMKIALEAGTPARWVGRMLREAKHEVYVADPRKISLVTRDQRKSDRNDAITIAKLVKADVTLLNPIEGFLDRSMTVLTMVRQRDALVRSRTLLINAVRNHVKQEGHRIGHCDADDFIAKAKKNLPKPILREIASMLPAIATISGQIAVFDRRLLQKAAKEFPEMERLQKIPGVGPITSACFVALIGAPKRFTDSRDVGAYFGLVPRLDQSGNVDKDLSITKAGDKMMRRLLVLAARAMLSANEKGDCALKTWAETKMLGEGKSTRKRIVVGLARKLAVVMHRICLNKCDFNPWPQGKPQTTEASADSASSPTVAQPDTETKTYRLTPSA